MKKILFIFIIACAINLVILSIGHSQTSVGVKGYVPETNLNRNSSKTQANLEEEKPIFKENKYLYFFEKVLGLQQEAKTPEKLQEKGQTFYDQIFSLVAMWGLLLIFAVIFWLIVRILDQYISRLIRHKV